MTVKLPKDKNLVPIQVLAYQDSNGDVQLIDETSPLLTGVSNQVKKAATSFLRPADTTNYAIRDVVSDSASTTTLMEFQLGAATGGSGNIIKARLVTNNKLTTGVQFRLWLYTVSNATISADNAAMALLWANRANRLGFVDFPPTTTEDGTTSDSASTLATMGTSLQLPLPFVCDSGDDSIYGVLETLTAFTPASGQQFWVELTAEVF